MSSTSQPLLPSVIFCLQRKSVNIIRYVIPFINPRWLSSVNQWLFDRFYTASQSFYNLFFQYRKCNRNWSPLLPPHYSPLLIISKSHRPTQGQELLSVVSISLICDLTVPLVSDPYCSQAGTAAKPLNAQSLSETAHVSKRILSARWTLTLDHFTIEK